MDGWRKTEEMMGEKWDAIMERFGDKQKLKKDMTERQREVGRHHLKD